MDCYNAMNNHLKKYFDDNEIFVFEEKYSPDFHLDLYVIVPGGGQGFLYSGNFRYKQHPDECSRSPV